MSQIFREQSEKFNPQIHTEEFSLTVNMNKHFEVKKKTFDLFAVKNKFISWLYATGRVNMGVNNNKVMSARESISDNAYRVQYRGSLFTPSYATGDVQFGDLKADGTAMAAGVIYGTGVVTAADIIHNVIGTIAVKHDFANNIDGSKYNEGDVIALGAYTGARFIVMGKPFKNDAGDAYYVNFKVNSKTGLFKEADVADDELLSEAGNRFGEGSNKGYQRERRNKWKINYSFISRASLTITGSALNQQVAIISNPETGAKMWEFEAVLDLRERHQINLELGARHSRTSMDSSSHAWYENYGSNLLTLTGFSDDFGIVAPVIGDGWIAQLDDSFTVSYDPNNDLAVDVLEMFMTVLAQRSPIGSTGNTFVVLSDKLGHIKWDAAMKLLIGWTPSAGATLLNSNNIVFNAGKAGQEIELGFSVDTYHYLKNKMVFIEDELSNHPAFAPQNGGIIGTGTMYVMNATLVNGVSNIDLLARTDRALRAKYIDGIHSLDPNRNNSSYAASGFDGGRYDLLSEILPIIYSTESCGRILASAKYLGGAISSNPVATEQVTEWYY